jgi:hypothetical protein
MAVVGTAAVGVAVVGLEAVGVAVVGVAVVGVAVVGGAGVGAASRAHSSWLFGSPAPTAWVFSLTVALSRSVKQPRGSPALSVAGCAVNALLAAVAAAAHPGVVKMTDDCGGQILLPALPSTYAPAHASRALLPVAKTEGGSAAFAGEGARAVHVQCSVRWLPSMPGTVGVAVVGVPVGAALAVVGLDVVGTAVVGLDVVGTAVATGGEQTQSRRAPDAGTASQLIDAEVRLRE